MSNLYDLEIPLANGKTLPMINLRNKVLLVVNIASECGFTPQMLQLQELKEDFKAEAFEIIAVPSNDFAGQEPLNNQSILEFCDIRFKTSFPIAAKSQVRKGPEQNPLIQWLSDRKQNKVTGLAPVWNFHKYLIGKDGQLKSWYFPFTQPKSERVLRKIRSLLNEN